MEYFGDFSNRTHEGLTRVLQSLHPDRNYRSEPRNPDGYLRYSASQSSPPFCFKVPNLSSNKANPGSRKPTENRYGWNDRFYLFYLRMFEVLLKFEHLDFISEVRKSTDHCTIHNHQESSKSRPDLANRNVYSLHSKSILGSLAKKRKIRFFLKFKNAFGFSKQDAPQGTVGLCVSRGH